MTKKNYNREYYVKHRDEIRSRRNKGVWNVRPLLTGEKFNVLTVISLCEKDKYGKVCYLCKCDCGNNRKVRRSYLLSGRVKSCGCLAKLASKINGKKGMLAAQKKTQKFVGDLSGQLWSRILSNAKIRNFTVEITKEYAWELFLKQNKKCAITGLGLYLNPHHNERSKVTASLDRINPSIGYVSGNVQWVHKDINKMRNNFSVEYFKEMCKRVVEYDTKPIE